MGDIMCEYDETKEEIELIDNLLTLSIRKGDFATEEEMNKILLEK